MQLLEHRFSFYSEELKKIVLVLSIDWVDRTVNFGYPEKEMPYNKALSLYEGTLLRHSSVGDHNDVSLIEYDIVENIETGARYVVYMSQDWGGWALWWGEGPEKRKNLSMSSFGFDPKQLRKVCSWFDLSDEEKRSMNVLSLEEIENEPQE